MAPPAQRSNFALELLDFRPNGKRVTVQHFNDGINFQLGDVGLREWDGSRHLAKLRPHLSRERAFRYTQQLGGINDPAQKASATPSTEVRPINCLSTRQYPQHEPPTP